MSFFFTNKRSRADLYKKKLQFVSYRHRSQSQSSACQTQYKERKRAVDSKMCLLNVATNSWGTEDGLYNKRDSGRKRHTDDHISGRCNVSIINSYGIKRHNLLLCVIINQSIRLLLPLINGNPTQPRSPPIWQPIKRPPLPLSMN